MSEISFDEWAERFHPIENTFVPESSFSGTMFETHGEEWEFVKSAPRNRVWTYISEDGDWIVPGRRYVNRIGYFVTTEEFEDLRTAVDIRL